MDIAHYFDNPEELNKETLYELRNLIALYPFYQPARILLLKNLFLLHDATFDEELRRAAIYITNRRVLFNLVEAAHYQLRPEKSQEETLKSAKEETPTETNTDRTVSLIDNFLEQIPDTPEKTENGNRKPTPVDATVDYVAYLMNAERQEEGREEAPELRGQSLIDNFIHNEGGKIVLQEETEYKPENIDEGDEKIATAEENGYFTETLARIYIKQGRYSKALEIINRLNLVYPKKSRYFADQIRFLQKLIINNNKK
ncbi:tetratricopeptide repeat protein [Prevotella nigrescens]